MVASSISLPHPYYQLEEYYALLSLAETRYEYWAGEIFCMSGELPQHAMICDSIFYALLRRLKGSDYQAFSTKMPIKTPTLPPFRFPDASVAAQPEFEKVDKFDTLANPILVVAVSSRGTAGIDCNEKKLAYQALPSMQEYVLVAQDLPHATRYVRRGKQWQRFDCGDLQAVVELSSIKCTLPLQEIYQRIEFN